MSDVIARGGIEVYGDTTSFEAAMAKAEAAAKRFETGATTSAGKASAAVAGVGRDAAKGVGELDAATKRAIDSLQLMAAKAQLSPAAFQLFKAELKGLNTEAIAPYAAALGKAMDQQAAMASAAAKTASSLGMVGISAGQATNAMRQLPAQITDVVTGLTSGQSAMTVLIQQGGQLRDSFGGVGNVFRALGTVLTPVRLALGGAAAAIVTLGLAYKQGSAEADEYRRALVLTGNAAGGTVAQLQAAAEAVARSVGTQGKAAEVIAQLAATGRVAAADLGKLAEAAIRLERVGGPAADETAKAFADLGKEPAKAVVKLNESTNFLTLSLYRQIKALEDQGNAAGAAALAQNAFADAMTQRAGQLEANLGAIERAWRAVKDGAKQAWDDMLGIGRKDTAQTLYEKTTSEIARLRDSAAAGSLVPRDPAEGTASALRLQALEKLRDGLARVAYEESKLGIVQAAGAAQAKEQIAAESEREKALKRSADEFKRMAEAGAKLAQGFRLDDAGLSANFIDQWSQLNAAFKAGALGADQLNAAQKRLLDGQKFAQDEIKRTVAAYQVLVDMQALRADGEREIQDAEDRARKSRESAVEQVQSAVRGLEDEAQATRLAAALRISQAEAIARVTLARMEDERARLVNDPAELAALERKIELQRQIVAATGDKATRDANAKAAQDAAREWDRTVDSIREGLTDAFRRAFESGEDFGSAFAKTIGNEIKARIATALAGALADGVLAALGLQAASAAAGRTDAQGSPIMSGISMASAAKTVYGWGQSAYGWATGASAAGATAATGASAMQGAAAWNAAYTGSTTAAAGAGAGASAGGSSAASTASSWGPYVAAIVASYLVSSNAYKKGFTSQNQDSTFWESPLSGEVTNAAARLMDSLGIGSTRTNQIFSGAAGFNYLVGRGAPRLDASGVQGTLSAGDFTGQQFADVVQKGGLFRSDKRWTEVAEASEELNRFFDTAAKAVFDKAKDYGDALGLPVDALASITSDIKVALTDDAAENIKSIESALAGYGDALVAGYADAVKPLALYGETTIQTIERVGGAISGVNAVLEALGGTALAASIDGGQAAMALQDLFGGLQGIQQAAAAYAQNFYSDTERRDLTSSAISRVLGDVNLSLPATREEFRRLVEAQDLTTDSGRRAVAALMSVQQAFADMTPLARSAADILAERQRLEVELLTLQGDTAELRRRERDALDQSNRGLYDQIKALEDQQAAQEAAAEAAEKAADAARRIADGFGQLQGQLLGGVQGAFDSAASAIEAERNRVRTDADAQANALQQRAREIAQAFEGAFRSLDSAMDRINGTLAGDGGRGSAMGTLQGALADLQRGRPVNLDAVASAAGTASQLGTDGFGSRADYARALADTQALLRQVRTAAGARMQSELFSVNAQQAAVMADRDRQIAVLDAQLKAARSAAETLISIDDGVQGVAGAILRLGDAISAVMISSGARGAAASEAGRWLKSGGSELWASAAGAFAVRAAGAGPDDTMIRGLSGATFSLTEARDFIGQRIASGNIADLRARQRAEGIDSASLDAILGLPAGTAADDALLSRVVGRRDPSTAGWAEVAAELRLLREQSMTNDHALASFTRKTSELLDDAINGGASITTRAEP